MTMVYDLPELFGPLEYFVHGEPATQGSKVAFRHATSGKVIVKDSNKRNPAWRAEVAFAARAAMASRPLMQGPIAVVYHFYLSRPKKDYKRDGTLRPDAPKWPLHKMDIEKMARSVGDAMTGFVYPDDGQICFATIYKAYADGIGPGVAVRVTPLESP
jgi:Holliday junction resolvase RusA-like endonuclease